jgi:hypothetical protein
LILLPTLSAQMFAQAPPKPPVTGGSGGHGGSGDAPDGAPLDGGLSILLLMGAAYGGKKIQSIRKKNK